MFLTPVKEWLREDLAIQEFLKSDSSNNEIFERIVNLTTERLTKHHFRAISRYRSRGRTVASMRYHLIKKMRRRIEKFLSIAKTKEEKEAWEKTLSWMKTLIDENRTITPNGAIGMKNPVVEKNEN